MIWRNLTRGAYLKKKYCLKLCIWKLISLQSLNILVIIVWVFSFCTLYKFYVNIYVYFNTVTCFFLFMLVCLSLSFNAQVLRLTINFNNNSNSNLMILILNYKVLICLQITNSIKDNYLNKPFLKLFFDQKISWTEIITKCWC